MKLNNIIKKRLGHITEHIKYANRQMTVFGYFGLIAYPLFYFLNLYALTPKHYETLILRLIASFLCLLLILKDYWPVYLKRFIAIYWYATLIYALPFFFVFMLLKNNATADWMLNLLTMLFFTILVLDWISASIIFSIGSILGWLAYYWTTPYPFIYANSVISYKDFLGAFIVTLILGLLFSRNKEKAETERIETIKMLSAVIAHELRTPLAAINLKLKAFSNQFPRLLQGYQDAITHQCTEVFINKHTLELLKQSPKEALLSLQTCNHIINSLLMNVQQGAFSVGKLETRSMRTDIETTIAEYPFQSKEESKLVHVNLTDDFSYQGQLDYTRHLLFNLLNNALYYVKDAGKGEIHITLKNEGNKNLLLFKDTGKGIPKDFLPHIFDRFTSRRQHGTGLGLAFCKMMMKAYNGDIHCSSDYGNYTEFILSFPKIEMKT